MNLDWLKQNLQEEMQKKMASPTTMMFLKPGFVDKRFYAIYLTETYHYTFHNSRNQALVAARREEMNINYMKFCLKHAQEEAGHEMMALHDLRNLLDLKLAPSDLPAPLKSTQELIDYLYATAATGNPVARLGYSFWAERIYEFIGPMLYLLQTNVGVSDKAMTFFKEHADIDEHHAKDVDQAITSFVKTEADWKSVNEAMLNSLHLTAAMVDEVMQEFAKLKETNETRYGFLK